MNKSILRLPKVKDRSGKCRSGIYRDMRAGTFPLCVKIGERAVGWLESDIDAWIEERAAAASKKAGAK